MPVTGGSQPDAIRARARVSISPELHVSHHPHVMIKSCPRRCWDLSATGGHRRMQAPPSEPVRNGSTKKRRDELQQLVSSRAAGGGTGPASDSRQRPVQSLTPSIPPAKPAKQGPVPLIRPPPRNLSGRPSSLHAQEPRSVTSPVRPKRSSPSSNSVEFHRWSVARGAMPQQSCFRGDPVPGLETTEVARDGACINKAPLFPILVASGIDACRCLAPPSTPIQRDSSSSSRVSIP